MHFFELKLQQNPFLSVAQTRTLLGELTTLPDTLVDWEGTPPPRLLPYVPLVPRPLTSNPGSPPLFKISGSATVCGSHSFERELFGFYWSFSCVIVHNYTHGT